MKKIKKLRLSLGLTQVKFAELLETSQMTIHRWENEKCPSYIENLAKISLEETWKKLKA